MNLCDWSSDVCSSDLYLHATLLSTLALKLFRGEPAISGFDWNFTAIHRSSPVIATNVRSVLDGVLPPLQPAHG